MNLSRNYIEKHLEPSRNNWKVEPASLGLQKIQTHNGYNFSISGDREIDWKAPISFQEKTSRMWLLSLSFLVRVWEDNRLTSIEVLRSFHKFLSDQTNAEFVYSIASADHCAASRLRTMCFVAVTEGIGSEAYKLASEIAERDCRWIMASPKALPMNNHGMMVATALLHVCAIMNLDINNDLSARSKSFLQEMLSVVFDKNGFCNENTVGYHDFYRKTLTQLRDFSKDYGVTDVAALIDEFLPTIENALYKTVWNSGGIPPIGDSGEYLTRYKSIPGLHAFDTGMTVYKDDKTYLSVICGCLTETHKHMDDLSVTLRHLDTDLIIDCGSYNYDWNDPIRLCVASANGHSCLSFQEIDQYTRGNFHREYGKNYVASSKVTGNNPPSIQCDVELRDKGIVARRDVILTSPEHIVIRDSFTKDSKALQRFIIPGEASVTVVGTDVLVQNGNVSMLIAAGRSDVIVARGQKEPTYKGWASKKFGEIEPAYCVEIHPKSRSSLQTHIYFGEGENGKPNSLPKGERFMLSVRNSFRRKNLPVG
ncbi:heparinase II/III domain-containing protein [Ochrobactrum sp. MYb379]|uniref:heparinase II/III domain-containing protein n=1 Tax=Ochrobactrum sp. MYb379 TaxID=2745275 RepID=UPI0030B2558E